MTPNPAVTLAIAIGAFGLALVGAALGLAAVMIAAQARRIAMRAATRPASSIEDFETALAARDRAFLQELPSRIDAARRRYSA